MLVVILFCGLLFIIAVISWRAHARELHAHALPPAYPGALPVVGHTHLLLCNTEKLLTVMKLFASDSLRQGGVTVVFIAREIYYVITDPEDILTASNSCLQKHFAYSFAKAWMGDGLVTGSGETWKRHRKLLNPAFSLTITNGFIEVFNSQSRALIDIVEPYIGKGPFDILPFLRKISLETFCLTAFGVGKVDEEFIEKYMQAVDEIMNLIINRFSTFYLHNDLVYKLSGLKNKEAALVSVLHKMSVEIMQKKRTAVKDQGDLVNESEMQSTGRCKPLLDLLLSMSDNLTDQEIRDEINTNIMAGFDTSSLAIFYITMILGSHPDEQEKVYEEIIAVIGPDRDVEKNDVNKLVYIDAVIKETARIMSAVPVLLRYVDKDVKLKNFTMRAGSQCMLMPIGTHQHEVWGTDRQKFRPERWLDAASMTDSDTAFGGFSWGKRSCIGKTYAMIVLKVTLAHFIRRYRVKTDISKMKLKLEFIVKPSSEYEISIESRY